MVELEPLDDDDASGCSRSIERHRELTGSARRRRVCWRIGSAKSARFRKVMPRDYKRVLTRHARGRGGAACPSEEALERVMVAAHG